MAKSKSALKKSASPKVVVKKSGRPKAEPEIPTLVIENGIPIPKRGISDPEFLQKLDKILKEIKVEQSFVISKKKLHSTQKYTRENYENLKIRSSLIKPDKKFVRIWRMA